MTINSYLLFLIVVGICLIEQQINKKIPRTFYSFFILSIIFDLEVIEILISLLILSIAWKKMEKKFLWMLLPCILLFDKIIIYIYGQDAKLLGLSFLAITFTILAVSKVRYTQILNLSLFFPHVIAGPIIFEENIDSRPANKRILAAIVFFIIGMFLLELSNTVLDHLNIDEGKKLIKKYDGEFPNIYFNEIMEYLNIRPKNFFRNLDKFRSPHLWKKTKDLWKLRHTVNRDGTDD